MNTEVENRLRRMAKQLAQPAISGYLQRPLPTELDHIVSDLLDDFAAAPSEDREKIIDALALKQSAGLLTFAERMAILAVREGSVDRLKKAVLALVVEGFRWDERETILVLSLIAHSASKLGIEIGVLLDATKRVAPEPVARHIAQFLARTPEDRSISAMGYSEVMTAEGFGYRRDW
jgi:hypothetical protein